MRYVLQNTEYGKGRGRLEDLEPQINRKVKAKVKTEVPVLI
jgi:hypothetical protein